MEYITESPILPDVAFRELQKEGSGSLIFHYAVVKSLAEDDSDKITTAMNFERAGDAESELAAITNDIKSRWNVDDVLLVRRIGTLQVGDIISLVAVSASRSKDAFESCQYGLQLLKKMTTLKKKEVYLD